MALPTIPLAARRSIPAGQAGLSHGEADRSWLQLDLAGFGACGGCLGGCVPLGAGGADGGDEGWQGDVQDLQAGKLSLRAGGALWGRASRQHLETHGVEGNSWRAYLRGDVGVCQAQDVHCLHAQWRQRLQAGRAEPLNARHAHLADGNARHHAVHLGDSHGIRGGASGRAARLAEGAGSSVNHAHSWDSELYWPRLDGNKGGVGGQAGRDHLDAPDRHHAVGSLGLALRVQGQVAEEVSLGSSWLGSRLLRWDFSVG